VPVLGFRNFGSRPCTGGPRIKIQNGRRKIQNTRDKSRLIFYLKKKKLTYVRAPCAAAPFSATFAPEVAAPEVAAREMAEGKVKHIKSL